MVHSTGTVKDKNELNNNRILMIHGKLLLDHPRLGRPWSITWKQIYKRKKVEGEKRQPWSGAGSPHLLYQLA